MFLQATCLFFSGDITKISGNTTQVLGDMASGEMTLGRLDRLPAWIHRERTPLNSSFETHERETLELKHYFRLHKLVNLCCSSRWCRNLKSEGTKLRKTPFVFVDKIMCMRSTSIRYLIFQFCTVRTFVVLLQFSNFKQQAQDYISNKNIQK